MDLAPEAIAAPAAPPPAPVAPAAGEGELARALGALAARAADFARLSPREKAALLRSIVARLAALGPALAGAFAVARGLDAAPPGPAEAWIFGVTPLVAQARALAESLEDLAAAGRPALAAGAIRKREDGVVVARLAARTFAERTAQRGRDAMVVFGAGTEPEDVISGQASFYRQADRAGGVALVLAGRDDLGRGLGEALHALFVEGRTVLLQTGIPSSLVANALQPLVDAGHVHVTNAPIAEAAKLAADPALGRVHFTGPRDLFDVMVWGPPGADREARMAARAPLVTASISAILGGPAPLVIVPCLYAKDELAYLALRIAAEAALDATFDPPSARALVLPGGWLQRDLFLDELRRALAALRPRPAVDPDHAEPWRLDARGDLDPEAPIAGHVIPVFTVGSDDPVRMLPAATDLSNRLGGSMAAEIVMHPVHEDDPVIVAALERAVIDLRYGVVGLDRWPALGRLDALLPSGAHPSGELLAPRGGLDLRGGARMLARADKAVIKGPLVPLRRPLHLRADLAAAQLAQRIAAFQAAPRLRDLPALAGRV